MRSTYRFEGAFRVLHVIPRGTPPPMHGVRTSFLALEFELGGNALAANERERARLLSDLGFQESQPGMLDIAERYRRSDRLREEIERSFDVYEVRRHTGWNGRRQAARAAVTQDAIPGAPHAVLTAEVKFIVHVPFPKDEANQLPHKFTLTNDDRSYSKTLTLASDAEAGDQEGMSDLTFTDMTDGHSYSLEIDDGETSYKLFESVAYVDLQDIQVPAVDSSPSMPSLSDPDDDAPPSSAPPPSARPSSAPPSSAPPSSDSAPSSALASSPPSSQPPSSGAPDSAPAVEEEDTIAVSTDEGTADDGSPASSGADAAPTSSPDRAAASDDAPSSGQGTTQPGAPTAGSTGTANGWTDDGVGDISDDDDDIDGST